MVGSKLTLHHKINPFRHGWRDIVAGDTKIGAHVLSPHLKGHLDQFDSGSTNSSDKFMPYTFSTEEVRSLKAQILNHLPKTLMSVLKPKIDF